LPQNQAKQAALEGFFWQIYLFLPLFGSKVLKIVKTSLFLRQNDTKKDILP
jgi:hypothetical protein